MFWKERRIYADAAAATPLSPRVKRELVRLLTVYGNPGALHQEALEAKRELDSAREVTATAIGAHPDEIVFTSGGTEGNVLAIEGTLRPLLRKGSVHAITTCIEHSSVLEPLRALQVEGLALTELPVNSAGRISLQDLEAAITPQTALVSIQFINSEIGTIQAIKDIAKLIRHARKTFGKTIVFHCEASQAPLWKTIRVDTLGVDLLTLDGQKILGPKGVGALYVRRTAALEAQQRGGNQERGLRSGTENVPLIGAFAVALRDAQKNEDAANKRIAKIRNTLLQEILRHLPDVVLNGAVGDERAPNNLNISVPHLDGQMAVIALSREGVAASTRSACDTNVEAPSHVLQALGVQEELMQCAIRITLLPSATARDAKRIAQILAHVAKRYRNMA
jgi:cysteine desulfurase